MFVVIFPGKSQLVQVTCCPQEVIPRCAIFLITKIPIMHHTWSHSSKTSIQHHGVSQVVGMSFMLTVHQSSFRECGNVWIIKELCTKVDAFLYGIDFHCIIPEGMVQRPTCNTVAYHKLWGWVILHLAQGHSMNAQSYRGQGTVTSYIVILSLIWTMIIRWDKVKSNWTPR